MKCSEQNAKQTTGPHILTAKCFDLPFDDCRLWEQARVWQFICDKIIGTPEQYLKLLQTSKLSALVTGNMRLYTLFNFAAWGKSKYFNTKDTYKILNGTMVHQVALLPHSARVPSLILSPGSCTCKVSVHVLPVLVSVLFGFFGFLPLSKNTLYMLISANKCPNKC